MSPLAVIRVQSRLNFTAQRRRIRPSGQERLAEAAKHGFRRAIVPKANAPKSAIPGMEVVPVRRLQEALAACE